MNIQIFKACNNFIGLVKINKGKESSFFIISAQKSSKDVINKALQSLI
jgi:hypothetical protein